MRQPALKFSTKTKRAQPEAELQKRVVQFLRLTAKPGVLFFSVPNEGRRSVRLASHYKAMGLRPGVSDLVIIVEGRVMFMELKHGANGLSEFQERFIQDALEARCQCCVVRTLDEALGALRYHGAIKEAA